jgi:integrase
VTRPLLTRADVEAVLRSFASRGGPCAIRNAGLVAVLAYGGLRVGEALRLTRSSVVWSGRDRGMVAVQTSKVSSSGPDAVRRVRLGEGALAIVQKWRERRAEMLGGDVGGWLFCRVQHRTLGGEAESWDPNSARRAIVVEGRRVGIAEGAMHPHGLRHFHAVELMRAGVHVGKIQRLLGHGSLSTTATYLSRFGDEEALSEQAAVFDGTV